ncbi:MAG: hypothetical protein RLZZ11_904, partial [Cyanobacteriota bacterium]
LLRAGEVIEHRSTCQQHNSPSGNRQGDDANRAA